MKGFTALQKSYEDDTIETKHPYGCKYYSNRERSNNCSTFTFADLNSDDWKVRKRKSNLEEVVEKLMDWTTRVHGDEERVLRKILSKHIKD